MSLFGSNKTTRDYNETFDTYVNGKQQVDPFSSDAMQQAYDTYLANAKQNYSNMNKVGNRIQNMIDTASRNGGAGDNSYFKRAFSNAENVNMSNVNKMNEADLNPYNDEVTRNYIKASNKAAELANGRAYNQALQNGIGSGMGNSSGHQTAMAKVGAQLAANINAQNQATYLQRQNALEQNALAANGQLTNFYNTLAGLGLDYAKLGEEDLNVMLNAYNSMINAQNTALGAYGNAVQMGSDPTTTTSGHTYGTKKGTETIEGGGGWGDLLGFAAGAFL